MLDAVTRHLDRAATRWILSKLERMDGQGRQRWLESLQLAAAMQQIAGGVDPHSNFGYSTVQAGSTIIGSNANPRTIVLGTGDGAAFPSGAAFNVTIWPTSVRPTAANAEIARVTRSGDTLTTTARGQEGTAALSTIAAGHQVMAAVTVRTLTEAECPITTSLPASPGHENQCVLVDSYATPTFRWHLIYNASSASAYKWEFVGGSQLRVVVPTSEAISAADATYRALTTPGPTVTPPVNGDYDVEISCLINSFDNAQSARMSFDRGGTGAVDGDAAFYQPSSTGITGARHFTRRVIPSTTLVGAAALTSKYKQSGGGTLGSFERREIAIIPVRLG